MIEKEIEVKRFEQKMAAIKCELDNGLIQPVQTVQGGAYKRDN